MNYRNYLDENVINEELKNKFYIIAPINNPTYSNRIKFNWRNEKSFDGTYDDLNSALKTLKGLNATLEDQHEEFGVFEINYTLKLVS